MLGVGCGYVDKRSARTKSASGFLFSFFLSNGSRAAFKKKIRNNTLIVVDNFRCSAGETAKKGGANAEIWGHSSS